jgi:hypothetical protein
MYQGPGPFSTCLQQLTALNTCYDNVAMMEQILAKVITDVITSNPTVMNEIIEGIAASGSNVPLIGVTNGADAQPGQVGQFVPLNLAGTYPTGTSTQVVTLGTLQPGDWDLEGILGIGGPVTWVNTYLSPVPAGVSWNMGGYIEDITSVPGSGEMAIIPLVPARALISVPTLFAFSLQVNAGTNAGANYQYVVNARRAR